MIGRRGCVFARLAGWRASRRWGCGRVLLSIVRLPGRRRMLGPVLAARRRRQRRRRQSGVLMGGCLQCSRHFPRPNALKIERDGVVWRIANRSEGVSGREFGSGAGKNQGGDANMQDEISGRFRQQFLGLAAPGEKRGQRIENGAVETETGT